MNIRHRKAASFFKRHVRLLSLAGALVVFVTFVVKEGLADRWKEEASAIDMAEYIYAIRADTSEAVSTLRAVDQQVSQDTDVVAKRPGVNPFELEEGLGVKAILQLALEEANTVGRDLRNISILVEKLPNQEENRKEVQRLINTQQQYSKQLQVPRAQLELILGKLRKDNIADRLRAENRSAKDALLDPEDQQTMNVLGELLTGILKTSETFTTLLPEDKKFVGNVLDGAERLRRKNEKRSNYAWWIAAVLYTIGWGLAVLSRLYDLPAASD